MDTMKDTTMQHVTDVSIVLEAAAEFIAGLLARIEQLESDLATAEQDSRQKQARIDRLEAAEKDIALKERMEKMEAALRIAVRQNSHDMLMTGDELRRCEAALEESK